MDYFTSRNFCVQEKLGASLASLSDSTRQAIQQIMKDNHGNFQNSDGPKVWLNNLESLPADGVESHDYFNNKFPVVCFKAYSDRENTKFIITN